MHVPLKAKLLTVKIAERQSTQHLSVVLAKRKYRQVDYVIRTGIFPKLVTQRWPLSNRDL